MQSVDELLAEAEAQTGLHDFGEDSFREGLERLVRALREEASLSAIGRHAMPALLRHLLAQRLQVEDWYRRHPEIDDEPIEAPLIGLGLPRTGSTALSFLLAEDPAARSLRLFEGREPCPPPSTVAGPDPRIARAEANAAAQAKLMPRMAAMLPSSSPTGPYECQDLMGLDFKSHYFQAYAHIPSYSDWLLREADLGSTYRYERRVLKLLQWGEPVRRPWRLKCPSHLLFLPQLDAAFPDARYVMTHRDPTDVMVSVVDVFCEVSKLMSETPDLHYLGRMNVEHWSVGMERALAFRDAGNDGRFYDMHFQAVQRDPIGEVRRLYAWLGEPVSEAFERGMERWWRENAETRAASVHPEPAAFGLDLERVRPLFAEYVERMEQWTTR
jgi:hypothetical protein